MRGALLLSRRGWGEDWRVYLLLSLQVEPPPMMPVENLGPILAAREHGPGDVRVCMKSVAAGGKVLCTQNCVRAGPILLVGTSLKAGPSTSLL